MQGRHRGNVVGSARQDQAPAPEVARVGGDVVPVVGLPDRCDRGVRAHWRRRRRGEVVDERALVKALRDKQIAGAALDVRNSEPPDQGPLNELDNVILTPHIAAFTREAQDRVVAAVCRDVAAVIAGGEAANHFNFPTPRRKNS